MRIMLLENIPSLVFCWKIFLLSYWYAAPHPFVILSSCKRTLLSHLIVTHTYNKTGGLSFFGVSITKLTVMDSLQVSKAVPATPVAPHKRPTARTWYIVLRGISFLLLIACLGLAIAAFRQTPIRNTPSCFADGSCESYSYTYRFPQIWQTLTVSHFPMRQLDGSC